MSVFPQLCHKNWFKKVIKLRKVFKLQNFRVTVSSHCIFVCFFLIRCKLVSAVTEKESCYGAARNFGRRAPKGLSVRNAYPCPISFPEPAYLMAEMASAGTRDSGIIHHWNQKAIGPLQKKPPLASHQNIHSDRFSQRLVVLAMAIRNAGSGNEIDPWLITETRDACGEGWVRLHIASILRVFQRSQLSKNLTDQINTFVQ